MRLKYFSWLIIVFGIAVLSCNTDDVEETVEGSFEGVFTVTYSNNETFSNSVEVTINNGIYSSTAGPDRLPAGGTGTYEILSNTITFEDEGVWTADFDWNLILNGAYSYTLSGNKLILSAEKNNVGTYTYELTRN